MSDASFLANKTDDSACRSRRAVGTLTGESDAQGARQVPLFPLEFCNRSASPPTRLSRRCRRRANLRSHQSREFGEVLTA